MSRRVIHHLTVLGLCCSVVLAASTVAHAGVPRTPTAQSHANADAVVAFDRSKTSPSRSFSIAYLTECVDNPYRVARLEGIRDAAKKYGATVKVFDSKWSLVAQERTAEIAVTEGVYDGYIFGPLAPEPSCKLWNRVLVTTGKPVVTVTVPMCGDTDYTPGLAATFTQQGEVHYQELVDCALASCTSECLVLAVGGFVGSQLQNYWEAAVQRGRAKYPNAKIVVSETANFDPRIAYKKTQDALVAHPDISVVVSNWDDMSRGIEQGIVSSGRKPGKEVRIYSAGVAARQKVEILRAIQAGREVLIMNEPTATLDPPDRQALYDLIQQLASAGSSIVFISHDLSEVLAICTRVSVMRDGALIETRPASRWTSEGLVAAMLGSAQAKPWQRGYRSLGPTVFKACDIRVPGRVHGISFDVRRGEILGVAGLVGSGRSELLRAIFGAERRSTGQMEIDGKVGNLPRSVREAMGLGIIMVPEDRKLQGLVLSRDGFSNIALGNSHRFATAGILGKSRMRRRFRQVAADVKMLATRLGVEVAKLSGGNQQKILLARGLVREPRLLLLDEPTRGVDVTARSEIYASVAALAMREVSVILVSSDIDEIVDHCDRVIVLQAGRCVGVRARGEADLESVLKLKFSIGGRLN